MTQNWPDIMILWPQRGTIFAARTAIIMPCLEKQYRYFVPEGKKVLEIGCGTGDLLAALKPSYGMGVDISPKMIDAAQGKYPVLAFSCRHHPGHHHRGEI